jgi:group I intron endonuclease
MKTKMIGAYLIKHIESGKFYVGSSKDINKRILNHYYNLNNGTHHNSNLQDLWNNDGSFTQTFFVTGNRQTAFELEQKIINDNRNSKLMLNIGLSVSGGDNITLHPNKSVILDKIKAGVLDRYSKMTVAEKKEKHGKNGENNPMYGKSHTEEARLKIRKANLGITRRSGYHLTEECKKLLSEKAKLRTGDKNSFYGMKHTDEYKKNASIRMKSKNFLPGNSRSVIINGEKFVSLMAAARFLNVSQALIIYRIKSNLPKYNHYAYI